ncbi:hypothetical protein GRI40_00710 [Altererythrobacter aerius]|uniref:Peptidase M56 domain-containing protein n=1 Tax=Tsuneonella aeria TaxID=1837929 RepID=A0A6I4T9F7_9SPHN|nr:M56 family metallopeptidase [Tsuneonella aeria]MXO73743.1 hypothetical protein [Tsuneonella aeria]
MTWLLETLVWTGALIAFVLLVRRPVARHFGARAAYGLWLLPVLRLAMPPIELPAWLATRGAAPAPAPVAAAPDNSAMLLAPIPSGQPAIAMETAAPIDWMALGITVWLAGAAIYVVSRLHSYASLRRELLAEARTVGWAGRIRLVETPATASPLAFGVIDKVVALPPEFMALPDRQARNLALAHELAHHRAHDLAANFIALPLFALHWFNPLAQLGWQAMRRDQEAACDSRVVDGCDRSARAAYAALIAHAVAGPRGALAAPMACPVLGDKSIVHRLRNLTMQDISTRRRRAGAMMVGAAALLLPLTASITYAQDEAPPAPEAPLPPPAAPAAPESPAAIPAPAAPVAPAAPAAPQAAPDSPAEGVRKVRRVVVVRDKDGETRTEVTETAPRVVQLRHGEKFDEKAFEEEMARFGKDMEKFGEEMGRQGVAIERRAMADARVAEARAHAGAARALAIAPRIEFSCAAGEGWHESKAADGKRVIRVCNRAATTAPLAGLRRARAQIAENHGMSEATRAEVLNSLDREIARLEKHD